MRISIKRRLLISNILMVVIPLVVTTVLLVATALFIFGETLPDFLSLTYTIPIEQEILDFDPSEANFAIADGILIYQLENGNYMLVLPEEMNSRFDEIDNLTEQLFFDMVIMPESLLQQMHLLESYNALTQVLIVISLICITLLVNFFLVKFVFKPIMTSLNILTEGVDEIADGNLGYRVKHDVGNEFDGVAAKFNEMAARLHEMVEQKKGDEQSRKELIAGIAHDLRTPLTSIRTYAEGLEMGMATTAEVQEKYLATIKGKTDDMEHLLNQLFLFSKLDIGEFPMRLDKWDAGIWLAEFIAGAREEYFAKGLQIELGENVENALILVDSVQLGNVLTNIFENSVKYANVEELAMTVECIRDADQIVIRMSDNGVGVASEDVDKLFDVFYRGDKARTNPSSGSGLGLAISAKIIERLGGKIQAENAKSGGLTLIIKLPIVGDGK